MKRPIGILLFAAILLSLLSASAVSVSGVAADGIVRYGKSTIRDEKVAYAYETIEAALKENDRPETIAFDEHKQLREADVKMAYTLFGSDHPEIFWLGMSYQYSILGSDVVGLSPAYSFTETELPHAKAELETAIGEILSELPKTADYDKALYLHDQLAKRVSYAFVGEHQTAYGALVSGKAVCAGYAAAYQLLLHHAGINAWTVSGYSNKPGSSERIAHAWNVVWLEEDVCVYTDVTWNDGEEKIYHSYFNLSRAEMDADHDTDALFLLPDCSHTDKSYFDINDRGVSLSTTAEQLAALFGPEENGKRSAVLFYEGANVDDFLSWISNNQMDIYEALGCRVGSCGYTLSALGNEIHMTVTGNFPPMTYAVAVSAPDTIRTNGEATQYVVIGEEMEPMIFIAASGYYFPTEYHAAGAIGIGIERLDARRICISGRPMWDTSITLPAPTQMQKEDTPSVIFSPDTAEGSGTLSGIEVGMQYSTDGVTWIDITADGQLHLTGLTAEQIYLIRKGNGEDTLDSDRQTLEVPNPIAAESDTVESGDETDGNGGNGNRGENDPNYIVIAVGGGLALIIIIVAVAVGKRK